MRRRTLLLGLAAGLPFGVPAAAQQPAARVGHLTGGSLAGRAAFLAAFREGLAGLGHVEGRNLVLDARGADGRFDRLAMLGQELIALKPDVLFVTTTPAALAAKAATATVPIVFAGVADPLGIGLVDSLARPGANVTGITNLIAELTGKRLELLKESVPHASRVAIIVNPDDANAGLQIGQAQTAARALGIVLEPVVHVRSAADLEPAFAAVAASNARAALRLADPTVTENRRVTAELAVKYRLPVMHSFREDVEAGGLIAYGSDLTGQHRQAATLVHKILRGAKPADLPVEQPTSFALVVNQRAARLIGLSLPTSLLARADEVIE
jgi:putative tryptophan/tyrosine transport system substrate-binding protein